jgi:hypothetical protein
MDRRGCTSAGCTHPSCCVVRDGVVVVVGGKCVCVREREREKGKGLVAPAVLTASPPPHTLHARALKPLSFSASCSAMTSTSCFGLAAAFFVIVAGACVRVLVWLLVLVDGGLGEGE